MTFFGKVTDVYPFISDNIIFLLSLALVLFSTLLLLMTLFSFFIPARPLASLFILIAAFAGYYTDKYGIVIDNVMIRNIIETNINETKDLITNDYLIHLLLLGIFPILVLWRFQYRQSPSMQEMKYKLYTVSASITIIVSCIYLLGDSYAGFFRAHKTLRYYANPTNTIYAVYKYSKEEIKSHDIGSYISMSSYAALAETDKQRELIILVVGETARSDHFSINGYHRLTNPRLSSETQLVSFSNITSCGTSTAISVPCMFSFYGRNDFELGKSNFTENSLDTLNKAGVNILWRDNNSDSKGVATRISYEDYKSPGINTVCDEECRDVGMLGGLQDYVDSRSGDILIVLHQMGSHGPAYYKRYPKEFEQFKPACSALELSKCTNEEIVNAYDNTILYTDYFLSKVIEFLKNNTPKYETAMLYVSDHGESLGEYGLFLHGMPYRFAPESQIKVPLIAWVGNSSDIDFEKTYSNKDAQSSHDALSCTLLSVFEIDADLTTPCNKPLVFLNDID